MDERHPGDPRRSYAAYVASLYAGQGWTVRAARAAGEPDVGADLLAYVRGDDPAGPPAMVIQCRRFGAPVDVAAVQAVHAARDFYGAAHGVLVANEPLTAQAQLLAERLGVYVRPVDALAGALGMREDIAQGEMAAAAASAESLPMQAAPAARPAQQRAAIPRRRRPLLWLFLAAIGVGAVLFAAAGMSILSNAKQAAHHAAAAAAAATSARKTAHAAKAVAPPQAPQGVQATNGSSSVQIAWTAVQGATSYTLWRQGSVGPNASPQAVGTSTATAYTDQTVQPDTTYTYWVVAQGAGGTSGPSQMISLTTYVPWTTIHSQYADSIVKVTHCDGLFCSSQSGGTGWFGPGGYIVTNYHVVQGARYYINVTLHNDGSGTSGFTGQTFHAHVVAVDSQDDLALLQLDNGWSGKPLPLGSSAGVQVGDPVGVLGHPGLEQLTLTTGTVQALGQTVQVQNYGALQGMISYNAGVVGGSSGSPVFDHWGNVVGIEESAGTTNGNADYAVPVSDLKAFLAQNGISAGGQAGSGTQGTGSAQQGTGSTAP